MVYSIYLAGPMQHDSNSRRWREDIKEGNNVSEVEFIDPYDIEDENQEGEKTPASVVEPDKEAIDNCDAVLARWKRDIPSPGTSMEILYAWERDIPVVVWEDSRYDLPFWIDYHSLTRVRNPKQAILKCIEHIE